MNGSYRTCGFGFTCNRVTKLSCGRQPGPRPARIQRLRRMSFLAARSKHDGSKSRGCVEPQGGKLGKFQPVITRP
jgi:hypothetical protein